jgi:hypothetical protein
MSRSEDAIAFDRHLDATAPDVADIARTLRETVLAEFHGAIEWFDPGNGLLAFGAERAMKALQFAIIPHKAHVNLQLADGAELPNPDGRIEGSGKRIRHVKVRSVDDAKSGWVRGVIRAQLASRAARP